MNQPLVSAIMPTRGRPTLAWRALACYLSQTYERKELIILDDADEPSFATPDFPVSVRYIQAPERYPIGQKRNTCCLHAHGSIIMHLDDDDWSAPERMAEQVHRLLVTDKSVTGYHSMAFFEEQTGRWAKYCGAPDYALGTSLCYYRSWWSMNPFDERSVDDEGQVHEDSRFVDIARAQRAIISADASGMLIARAHAGNTAPKLLDKYNHFDGALAPRAFLHTL